MTDLVLVNGSIRTLDPRRPTATAVLCLDGMVAAVGGDAEVMALRPTWAPILDLAGTVVVPGLIDSHIHPFNPELAVGVDLSGCGDLGQLWKRLEDEEKGLGVGEWLLGWGLGYQIFAGRRIHRSAFERIPASRPSLLRFFDLHTAVANLPALELAGYGDHITFAGNSEIVMDGATPTGELRELPAIEHVLAAVPPPTGSGRRRRALRVQRELAAHGITGVHAMDGSPETIDLMRSLEEEGELTVRSVIPLTQHPDMSLDQMREQLELLDAHGRLWRGGVAKFFIDGVVESGTAWLEEPDLLGGGGDGFWPDIEHFRGAVALFAGAGFQCATHAIGDRAVREVLRAYGAARSPAGHVRHRIEHLETVQDRELQRMARDRVIPSMQPLHMEVREPDGSDAWTMRLGEERAARGWRTGDIHRLGLEIALGSDWPVASHDPRLGMAWARLRRPPKQPEVPVWDATQRLDAGTALRGYTATAAESVGEGSRRGRICEGYFADFTGFAEDPVQVPADQLPDLPVTLTVVDGRVMFHRS